MTLLACILDRSDLGYECNTAFKQTQKAKVWTEPNVHHSEQSGVIRQLSNSRSVMNIFKEGADRLCQSEKFCYQEKRKIKLSSTTYLEKRLRIRPAGVVSKKDIGDRKMAKAIRS